MLGNILRDAIVGAVSGTIANMAADVIFDDGIVKEDELGDSAINGGVGGVIGGMISGDSDEIDEGEIIGGIIGGLL